MMHPPFFHEAVVAQQKRELERRSRHSELLRRRPEREEVLQLPVMLRLCRAEDADVLRDLAALSGEPTPTGSCVLAEVEERVVAALPLAGGGPLLADPFRPTAHLVPLLQLRARQITGCPPRRPPRFRLLVPRWSRA
jgi:hypothetical protein